MEFKDFSAYFKNADVCRKWVSNRDWETVTGGGEGGRLQPANMLVTKCWDVWPTAVPSVLFWKPRMFMHPEKVFTNICVSKLFFASFKWLHLQVKCVRTLRLTWCDTSKSKTPAHSTGLIQFTNTQQTRRWWPVFGYDVKGYASFVQVFRMHRMFWIDRLRGDTCERIYCNNLSESKPIETKKFPIIGQAAWLYHVYNTRVKHDN